MSERDPAAWPRRSTLLSRRGRQTDRATDGAHLSCALTIGIIGQVHLVASKSVFSV
jgi:hypothetical protein